jgi:hypothetical protein
MNVIQRTHASTRKAGAAPSRPSELHVDKTTPHSNLGKGAALVPSKTPPPKETKRINGDREDGCRLVLKPSPDES